MLMLIVLGVLLLASFVACYFSSKYWHWGHVLLVETIFLLGIGYFLLAAEVFRIQSLYSQAEQRTSEQIERLEPRVEALEFGTSDPAVISQLEASDIPVAMEDGDEEDDTPEMLGLRDLNHKLGMVTRTRGRMWRDVETANLDQETLTVTLRVPAPNPHGIETDAILYAFEQGPASTGGEQGAQYIGEFRVVNTAPEQIQLRPSTQFDQRAVERLQNTRSPWILYENMPVDQHPDGLLEIFAGASPAELEQMLPAESVQEYIRHGTPANPDDDQWVRENLDPDGATYRRPLRDYNLIFQELSKRFTQMQADRNALVEDNKQLATALASARQLQSLREEEQQQLQHDLAGVSRDRQAIEAHLSQVETQLTNARNLLDATVQENAQLADSLSGG